MIDLLRRKLLKRVKWTEMCLAAASPDCVDERMHRIRKSDAVLDRFANNSFVRTAPEIPALPAQFKDQGAWRASSSRQQ